MSKVILMLSLLGVGLLSFFGVVNPNSSVMWMASTSFNFAFLRIILMAILVGLLVTNPPRNIYFRAFIAVFSVILVGWTLNTTYHNQMKFLDTLSLLEVSICASLTILERGLKTASSAA